MLYRRRKRLEEQARQEAAGVNLWTDAFDDSVRTKMVHAFRDACTDYQLPSFATVARGMILRDEGLMDLMGRGMGEVDDLLNYFMTCPADMVPTVIEAMAAVTEDRRLVSETGRYQANQMFVRTVSTVLREHRISYDLINGQMLGFASREMHVAVTVPALTLLAGRKEYKRAENAYHDALEEISRGKPGDAITDAGTALQETLETLGCVGNALGPLIRSAKTRGLLAAHDGPLLDSVEKVLHWVLPLAASLVIPMAHRTLLSRMRGSLFTLWVP